MTRSLRLALRASIAQRVAKADEAESQDDIATAHCATRAVQRAGALAIPVSELKENAMLKAQVVKMHYQNRYYIEFYVGKRKIGSTLLQMTFVKRERAVQFLQRLGFN